MVRQKSKLFTIITLVTLLTAGIISIPELYNRYYEDTADTYNTMCVGNYGTSSDYRNIEEAGKWATHDMIHEGMFNLLDNRNTRYSGQLNNVIKHNPDVQFAMYVPLMHIYHTGLDGPEGSLWADWADTFKDHLVRTNGIDPSTSERDTFAVWKRNYTINLTEKGVPELIAKTIRRYYDQSENKAELRGRLGSMLDFIKVPLPDLKIWNGPKYVECETGQPDMDNDGIGHWDDPDEQEALYNGYINTLKALRAEMPKTFFLCANGRSVNNDVVLSNGKVLKRFAQYVDGMYVEGFPKFYFKHGTQTNWEYTLNPTEYVSLTNVYNEFNKDHGGPMFLIEAIAWETGQHALRINSIISHLFSNSYIYINPEKKKGVYYPSSLNGKSLELDLGTPKTDSPVSKGTGEDMVLFREFSNGKIQIKLWQKYGVNAFRYKVVRYDPYEILENNGWEDK